MHIRILVIAAATAAMLGSAKAEEAADDHLGTVHFPISCSAVQAKFDRAVALLHNFFYPDTVEAFQAVIQEDPSCSIAYWGVAMSELPNPLVPPFPPRQPQGRVGGDPAGQGSEDPDPARSRVPRGDRGVLHGLRQDRPEDPCRAL